MASSFWLLCIWHKPQRVTKQQKPYYSSTLHCLLFAITSCAHSVWLVRYLHQPRKGLATFNTHIHTVVSPFYHSLFSFKWKSRHTLDSIYQPQLGFARVSNRPHLFPEKSEAENRRYHNTDTWIMWVCVSVASAWKHGCVHYIHVLYVSVCTPLIGQGGLFLKNKTKQNKAATCFIFSYLCSWSLPGNFPFQLLIVINH